MQVEIGFWDAGSALVKSVCECLGCAIEETRICHELALFYLKRHGVNIEGIEISVGDCWIDIVVQRDEFEVFNFSNDDPHELVKLVKKLVKLLRI